MSNAAFSESLQSFLSTDMNTPLPPDDIEQVLSSPPFIPLPSSLNLRDLGLLPSSPIPTGLVYRSGAVHSIPPSYLSSLNLSMILDLRSEREVAASPNPDLSGEGVENVWVGWDEGKMPKVVNMSDFEDAEGVEGYARMYMDLLEVYKGSFRRGLEWVLRKGRGEVEGGMVVHCTAGKDRTGVLAALILSLAGAPRSLIAHDYELTRIGVEPSREVLTQQLKMWNKEWTDETPGMSSFVQVKGEFILAFFDAVDEKYGGVNGYVKNELGFSAQEVEEMKTVLKGEGNE